MFLDKFRGGKGNSMYLLFIQAISINNDKEVKETGNAEENNDFSIKVCFLMPIKSFWPHFSTF